MLGSCGLCSILKIKRIIREMIQNSLTRRQKCSDLFRSIRRRLPLPEEAKSERGGPGVVIQMEKSIFWWLLFYLMGTAETLCTPM